MIMGGVYLAVEIIQLYTEALSTPDTLVIVLVDNGNNKLLVHSTSPVEPRDLR